MYINLIDQYRIDYLKALLQHILHQLLFFIQASCISLCYIICPQGAWLCDPNYQPPPHLDKDKCKRSFNNIEDSKDEKYLKSGLLQPGLGLSGLSWAEWYSHKNSTVWNKHNKAIYDFGSSNRCAIYAPSGTISTSYCRFTPSLKCVSSTSPCLSIPLSSSLSRSGKSSSGGFEFGDEETVNALTWKGLNFMRCHYARR